MIDMLTMHGTRVMGRAGEPGTIETGKLADLVIPDSAPLHNIRTTRRIHRVVKGGVIHEPDTVLRRLSGD